MSPNSRRSTSRRRFHKLWLLTVLLTAVVAGSLCLDRKANAVLTFSKPASPHQKTSPLSDTSLPKTAESFESLRSHLAKLPLGFEANEGQTNRAVRFLSRGRGYGLFLTSSEAVFRLSLSEARNGNSEATLARAARSVQHKYAGLRMRYVGANPAPQIAGSDRLPGNSNYFIGKDAAEWRTNVPNYAKVKYQNLYPGIDLVLYGKEGELEYDFVVSPGASPSSIQLAFEGTRKMRLDGNGDLVLRTRGGELRQRKPTIYQEVDGVRHRIDGRFLVKSKNRIGFEVAKYDTSLPLVIDPSLIYSTYIGGTAVQSGNDQVMGIAVDAAGNAYITGQTASSTFPVTPGAFDTTPDTGISSSDAFVTKLDPTGSTLIYSTYLGGVSPFGNSASDTGYSIKVDALGNAYVTGHTMATNFPTTVGAVQASPPTGSDRGFITKLNAAGSALVYSSYIGGTGSNFGFAVAIDATNHAYVAGSTTSATFPVTPGAFQTAPAVVGSGDAFVVKLNPAGSAYDYATYISGSDGEDALGIALDTGGRAYVAGTTSSTDFPVTANAFQTSYAGGPFTPGDAFLTVLDATGTSSPYSSYLGGSSEDLGLAVAVDPTGAAYIAGSTLSSNFPATPGAFQTTNQSNTDAFVSKINPSLSGAASLVYSTFLGGSALERAQGVAVDATGYVLVAGGTISTNFPITSCAAQITHGGSTDAFVTKLNLSAPGSAALVYSTFHGGSNLDNANDLAVDIAGNAYIGGGTRSTNFPTTPGAFQTMLQASPDPQDGFVAKFNPAACETCDNSAVIATIPVGTNPIGLSLNTLTNRIYVANFGNDTVSVIDGSTNSVITTVPVGSNPHGVAVNTVTNRIYIPNFSSDTVSVIDGTTNSVIATVGVGVQPRGVDVNEVTNRIYVANKASTDVSVIDGTTNTLIATVGVTSLPLGVAVNPTSNRIYVANLGGTTVSVIDGATNANVGSIPVGNSPLGVDVNSAMGRVYVTNTVDGTLSVINSTTDTVIATVPIGSGPYGVGVNQNTSVIYAANFSADSLSIVDGVSNSVIQTVTVADAPTGVGANPLTGRVYVANYNSNTVSVVDCSAGCIDDPDGDGVCNETGDNCPATFNPDQADSDNDGVGDACDQCPNDPGKTVPGACGCGVPETDSDNDGAPDCIDQCPNDPNKTVPGVCGCSVPDTDSDSDGAPDCIDQCPNDPNKTVPGVCGCGVPDTDSDSDAVADCVDNCRTTFNPDQRDTDGDGVGDVCTPFQFPAGGQFVVGNLVNFAGGSTVTFWGAQWSQNNPMSGGPAPNAFKGFENSIATPACGGTWMTNPGNSSNPPATVPQYMAVIVSSSIQKNGPVISGNIEKIIVVKTNPGYGPAPGHTGTGKVVAILCGSP